MKNQEYFNELMKILKILVSPNIEIPAFGEQNKYRVASSEAREETFEVIVNRKGHKYKDILTYNMRSKQYGGSLVRLDMVGSPHTSSITGETTDTPHLHIFDEEHNYGIEAIALSAERTY